MATTDRYVFAKVTPCACGQTWCKDVDTAVTSIPAPDPADWQAIVDAVKAWQAIPSLAGGKKGARWHDVASLALAAVRNMEARS